MDLFGGMRSFSGGETPPLRFYIYVSVGEAFRLPFKKTQSLLSAAASHRPTKSEKHGHAQFDAEGVIDHSSPYKGTAERSSATKKPHIKMEKPVGFSDGFPPIVSLFEALFEFELPLGVAFVLRELRSPKNIRHRSVTYAVYFLSERISQRIR